MESIGYGATILFPLLMGLVYIGILAVSIYLMILMIKVARRGIVALDIYIKKNRQDIDQF